MEHLVIAPDGRPCNWTASPTPEEAVAKLLMEIMSEEMWAFAQRQGYRVEQRRRERTTSREIPAHPSQRWAGRKNHNEQQSSDR